MRWHNRIVLEKHGVSLVTEMIAALAVNQGEPGSGTHATSVGHVRVVQGSDRAVPDSNGAKDRPANAGANTHHTEKEEHR